MFSFIKKNKWFLILSFILPLLLMATILAANGIYWGSSRSLLAGDAYHQYVAIQSLYRTILHSAGTQGFFYTFTSGLGLNLYAFSAYYMGSFFMPLTFFFNVQNMPDAMYLITLLKFAFIGLSAFISFKNMYQKVSRWLILALCISFSLMSFLTSQLEIIMWLDVFILLPLIIWGMHRLQDSGKRWLYFICLTLLFIQNYYFGFMIAIFLFLYFPVRATFQKWSWKKWADFLITSALATLTSMIMLLPMYLDLKANNSDAFSKVSQVFTDNAHFFDLFAKNFVGAYDTTQYNAVPMIDVGMMTLALSLLFFFCKSIRLRTKLAFLGLLGFLIASFYFQVLDLFWQGMHAPNMFLHRYAFLFSLLIVILACECLSRWQEIKTRHIILLAVFLSAGYLGSALFGHYPYLRSINFSLTLLFGLAYLLLSVSATQKWLPKTVFYLIFFVFVVAEAGLNGFYQVAGIQKEWNFAGRDYYNQQVNLLNPLAQKIQALTKNNFARADNTNPDTANDGMKYGYNSISQFSSVRNSNTSNVMRQLGFHTDDTYLNLRYPLNTLLMDSIFSVKYNINQFQPEKFGFTNVSNLTKLSDLTENHEAQSLGIFVPGGYQNAKFVSGKNKIIKNQTAFVNALGKTNFSFFKEFYPTDEHTSDKITGTGNQVTLTRKTGTTGDVGVTYDIRVPANSQAYLSVPNITYLSDSATNTTISISQISPSGKVTPLYNYYIGTNDTSSFFNLGNYPQTTQLRVSLSFSGNAQVSFDTTSFWALNTLTYQNEMKKLRKNPVTTKLIKNGAVLNYQAKASGDLFLSIPYDKGWSARLDGKKLTSDKLIKAQGGFIKIHVPAGKHQLTLTFFPQGLKTGILCFIAGILLFIFYDFLARKKNKKTAQ